MSTSTTARDPGPKEEAAGDAKPGSTPYVCTCKQRTADAIRREVIRLELKTVEEVYALVLEGGGCRTCAREIEKILEEVRGGAGAGGPRP